MRYLIAVLLSVFGSYCAAQQTLYFKISNAQNALPVPATVSVKKTPKNAVTDSLGTTTILFDSNGLFTAVVTAVGFRDKLFQIPIPYPTDTAFIQLEPDEEELDEVIVQSTRTSRTIANVPTRIETIALEEIDEKNNMRPANIAMLLHESTGIAVQQTSATSGNASIRIQGLDGRYTQLLKDGFANFGAFASGLSVLEIPPLDLKQVEIIKGPASPLFGGGAIAGVVNFISKTPKAEGEYNFLLNGSNIGQSNIGGFAAKRNKTVGYTLLALYNRQAPYDVDDDDFTEVPKSAEVTVHPKLFLYPNQNTTITLGNSFTTATRTGGDIVVVKNKGDAAHRYFEENKTVRNISTFELQQKWSAATQLVAKQSLSVFDRRIALPAYHFAGIDYTAFTDVSVVTTRSKQALVMGGNFIVNRFREKETGTMHRNNETTTGGLYAQHTWDATESVKLESGLRLDAARYSNPLFANTEVFLLPRVSLLVRYNADWSSRVGAGIGYKTPTLFTEETETMQYQNVLQLNNVTSEKSYGGTADVNFRTTLGSAFSASFNHMFFYTQIVKPLLLVQNVSGNYFFANATKPVQSAGFETNARFIYKKDFKLFLGYTFTYAKRGTDAGRQYLPLVPKQKLNSALIYEKEGSLKLGLEGYFTGPQYLRNGTRTPAFSEIGFMAEKIFNRFSLYINFENLTDTRQSRYKNVVNGSHLTPTFDEIWTHTEGFVLNGGIKLKF